MKCVGVGDGDGNTDGGVSLKDGVSKDRIVSVHDPEMLHGHKCKWGRFDGHKAAVVVVAVAFLAPEGCREISPTIQRC